MKILCHFNHFYGSRSALVGKSTVGGRERRSEVVRTALASIRSLPFDIETRVCGFPESSLVPINLDLTEIGNPMLIMYESIERMFREVDGYDYFLNIEDDVMVNEAMIRNCVAFNTCSSLNEVYLPNRMETGVDGSFYCVDLLALPGWQKALSRTFQNVTLGVAANHHSALFFLSRDQMRYAAERISLSRRDLIFSGYMASAFANVHSPFLLWRSRSDVTAHQVVHLDNWLQSPSDAIALPTKTIYDVSPGSSRHPMANVNTIGLEGASVKVRGWAIQENGEAMSRITLAIDDHLLLPSSDQLKRVDRPDVVSVFPYAQRSCGYDLSIPLTALVPVQGKFDMSHVRLSFHNEQPASIITLEDGALKEGLKSVMASLPVINETICMPEPQASRLGELMARATCFLEYGAGDATLHAVGLGIPTVLAVHSDLLRLEAVRYRAGTLNSNSNLHLEHIDIGWRSNIHDKASDAYWRSYEQHPLESWRYPLGIWVYCQTTNQSPDLVLIHGTYSEACFVAALMFARRGCRVLVDEFDAVSWNSQLLERLRPERHIGRMAEFLIPEGSVESRDVLWRMLLVALAKPN